MNDSRDLLETCLQIIIVIIFFNFVYELNRFLSRTKKYVMLIGKRKFTIAKKNVDSKNKIRKHIWVPTQSK